jgi:phosphonate transport system substrate-binding protein
LVKFTKDSLPKHDKTTIKVALTQQLSTCGYMQTKLLIHEFLHEDLNRMYYQYTGNHDNVALSILRGDFLLGGMKESIDQKYASLGVEILSYSAPVPGLMLIANTITLSQEEIDMIQKILLDAPKDIYQTWGESLSYGMSIPNLNQFNLENFGDLNYTIPKNGNF